MSLIKWQTSGTSGIPITVVWTKEAWLEDLRSFLNQLTTYDKTLERSLIKVAAIAGLPTCDPHTSTLPLPGGPMLLRLGCPTNDTASQIKAVGLLNAFQPSVITGLPSMLRRTLQARAFVRGLRFSPRVVICSGELLEETDREFLKEILSAKVCNMYRMAEAGNIAFECPNGEGLHIDTRRLVVEIVKDDVAQLPGVSGEIVVTTLTNRAMPLIRYRTGDHATLVDSQCSCGDSRPRLLAISGRRAVYFTRTDGTTYNPYVMNSSLRKLAIAQYKITQCSLSELVVEYVGFSDTEASHAEIRSIVKNCCGDVRVRISKRLEIAAPGGKCASFVSKVAELQ